LPTTPHHQRRCSFAYHAKIWGGYRGQRIYLDRNLTAHQRYAAFELIMLGLFERCVAGRHNRRRAQAMNKIYQHHAIETDHSSIWESAEHRKQNKSGATLAALFSSILHEEQNLSSRVAQIILLSH
jgi:hypothetical protein